jgi:3-hydroxyacyl-[acyl-carrier-protein] dehydratase
MRFQLLDRVDAHEPGKFLRGSKFLALGEEYLADHFPRFPVMPGVLMLQTLVEAASWLWLAAEAFRRPVVVLRETKNVKYGGFMLPGRRMEVAVDRTAATDALWTFRGKGTDDSGRPTVQAVFTLTAYSLSDRGPACIAAEQELQRALQARWALLRGELRPRVASPAADAMPRT